MTAAPVMTGVPCYLSPTCAAGEVVGGVVEGAAETTIQAVASSLFAGIADALYRMNSFWTVAPTKGVQYDATVSTLHISTEYFTAALAVAATLVAAIRMATSRSGQPAAELLRGLVTLVLVSSAGVLLVQLAINVTDWATLKIVVGTPIDFTKLGVKISAGAGLAPGMGLVLAPIILISVVAQMFLMIAREAVLVVLTGLLPLAAAGSLTSGGSVMLRKTTAWLAAFLLYKPAAAIIYTSAYLLIQNASDVKSYLSGLFWLAMAILALPALMRVISPLALSAGAGGGGAAALGAGATVLATGARAVAQRPSSSTGARAPGSSPGGGQPTGSGPGQEIPAAKNLSTPNGAAPAAATQGAQTSAMSSQGLGAAAGPVGVGVAAAGMAATKTKAAVDRTAQDMEMSK